MKRLSSWIHLLIATALICLLNTHIIEALILLVIMYEVGLEVPGFDRLFEYNARFVKFLSKKLDKKGKKNG